VDGIAAISSRIAAIQGTLAALAPQRATASTTTTATSASGTAFASVLATAVTQQATAASGPYSSEQMTNAAAIVDAGKKLGLSVRDQTIGVMTALGESSLTVVDHGDVAGPDSRGLFQQRANGAWGTLADRMDPTTSATSFFTALAGVAGRDAMAPTLVAHAVQRNADPNHYAKYWDDAVAIVSRLNA